MRIRQWICAILFSTPVFACEHLTVSVCTQGRLNDKTAIAAEAAAAALFHAVDIEIAWAKCEAGLEGDAATEQHWFTMRLREGRPFVTPATSAFDTMGEAFLSLESAGYIADVYYEVVASVAAGQEVELPALLGYVIAHELGHLLLGPGHNAKGIMRAGWDLRDIQAIRQGCLKFSPAEGLRMRSILR